MKQLRHFSLLFVLLLTSCTLSMEEWVETEEQKGYDEVASVENDFYTLKYEYKENTRSLTDEIQKYVAQVEDDSILYFLDNTPSEWLPQLGGQVVSNCCEPFPMGFMGRVLSIEKTNGLIKVVTTEATLEECYEEFDLDFDSDIFTSKPEEQEADTAVQSRFTRAGEGGHKEVVLRDWAMFRAVQSGAKQNNHTRSELEDVYDEDVDKKNEETTDLLLFEINPDGVVGKKIQNICKVLNTIDVKVYYTTKTNMHKIVQLKKKREYTSTTTASGIKLSALVGVDLIKAKTDKAKVETGLKVSKWLRDRDKFPKLSQKLDNQLMDDDEEMSIVVEIPIPSCPFGIVLRLMPVFDVNFGIYGDVEAIWWTSRSRTTTDVVNGVKVVDKSEKLTTPENKFAFNAFGSFHAGGGGELFLGLGKKLGKKAAGIGAFLQMTIDFDLNITPITSGDYTLGTADEFCSITGNGKFGGKILTGGFFGDISFLVNEFRWWDGVVWTFNPRVQYDDKFITVPDEDSNGTFAKQTMAYKYTSLGLNTSNTWTLYHKPVLCIYESDDQPLDEPTAVLYDKSSSKKVKKDTRYEFNYKNYEEKEIYIIPGVEGPGGKNDITLYTPYKTLVQPVIKPNIEYDLLYDDETKTYDYVYQDVEVEIKGDTYTYKWALPFTLRNAGAIDEYWDDWGVYNRIDGDGVTPIHRYTSLKDRITSSGKYMLINKLIFYTNYEKQVNVESGVYYVSKGGTVKNKINDYNAREYSYQVYKTNKKDPGNILLKFKLPLSNIGGLGYPHGYEKLKFTL